MKDNITLEIEEIDRMIHEPARLRIMIYLSLIQEADFTNLLYNTKLSRGNLSAQLQKLEAVGYIDINKKFIKRIPRTLVLITDAGVKALRKYKENLNRILSSDNQESSE
ncbi:MAG: transcriptional regulator [Candidatus Cloacimonetes bacterium]|jgi:DNA-binding transcriptional ArsR family regulator|nr:transcriptional regulator [Candidatus Cloacimonadota bacterium]MDD3281914.1 transcriptional regulator [Candidatus Cloacimonadota bacterium]MDD4231253.1 transcriptional regulator [Candidatus Cloacimonadota bacterium]MDD4687680.1 transcriptional regulator [Candidatus Cloacimonadota bacterium]MDY0299054.1 transcriptional regulator [Candidatus Cloacimonadaceae bacterium]